MQVLREIEQKAELILDERGAFPFCIISLVIDELI